jgi:hypothetical protein
MNGVPERLHSGPKGPGFDSRLSTARRKVAQAVEHLGLYSLLSFDTFPHFFEVPERLH